MPTAVAGHAFKTREGTHHHAGGGGGERQRRGRGEAELRTGVTENRGQAATG